MVQIARVRRILAELAEPSASVERMDVEQLLQCTGYTLVREEGDLRYWRLMGGEDTILLNARWMQVPRWRYERIANDVRTHLRNEGFDV